MKKIFFIIFPLTLFISLFTFIENVNALCCEDSGTAQCKCWSSGYCCYLSDGTACATSCDGSCYWSSTPCAQYCDETDTSCGIWPDCVNCNSLDGTYCTLDWEERETRDYRCVSNAAGCDYSATLIGDCGTEEDVCCNIDKGTQYHNYYCTAPSGDGPSAYCEDEYQSCTNCPGTFSECYCSGGTCVSCVADETCSGNVCIPASCEDSDNGDFPLTAGTCTDAGGDNQDTCSGSSLTEYRCSGTSCTSTTKNCEDYETLYCDGASGDIYRDEWRCSASPGYCNDGATDTLIGDCVNTCTETDGGEDYPTKGTVTDKNLCSAGQTSCPTDIVKPDECLSSSTLREYYCSGNDYTYTDKNCGDYGTGWTCNLGKCEYTAGCLDPDGDDPLTAGTCTDPTSYQDSCSGSELTEYYCSGTSCTTPVIPYNCDMDYDCTTGLAATCTGTGTSTLYRAGDDYICSVNPGPDNCAITGSKTCGGPWQCSSLTSCNIQSCAGTNYRCYASNAGAWTWGTSAETTETDCDDTYDNDCDGDIDCADTVDCASDPACTVCSALNYPSNKWQRVWYVHSTGACLGDGPDEAAIEFDHTEWDTGIVAYGKSDDIEFRSSRTISLSTDGTYTFTLGSDDGSMLWIDGTEEINRWYNTGYTTTSTDVYLTAGNHQFRIDYYENGGDARVSFSYTLPPCDLTVASVTANCASGESSTECEESVDSITISGSYIGDCSAANFFQIDAISADLTCDIQYSGGDMSGIFDTITPAGGSVSGEWTVPVVPSACEGKTVSATAAALYIGDSTGEQVGYLGTPTGSFTFYTPCTCDDWANDVCGGGTCPSTQMRQTRTCTPAGCEPILSRCDGPLWGGWIPQGCAAYCGPVEGYCTETQQCEKRTDSYGCADDDYRCESDSNCRVTSFNIYRGWNLISSNISNIDQNIIQDTCGATSGNFYYYNMETSKWVIDTVGIANLQKGVGYWFYSSKSCSVKITGSGNVEATDITIYSGWNQVGSPTGGMTPTDMNLMKDTCKNCGPSQTPGSCTNMKYLWYDPVAQNWEEVTSFEDGKGYHVQCIA